MESPLLLNINDRALSVDESLDLKVEQVLPAKLEGQLKLELENQIFEEWLRTKIQAANIQLSVN
jgi:hypothetical protein